MKKFLYLFFAVLATAACQGKKDFSPNEEAGLQRANAVSIFESKDSQKRWILNSRDVDFSDLQNAALVEPELLWKDNGKDAGKVTAERGVFNYAQRLVTLQGHVKAVSLIHGLTLETDHIYYDVDKDRVWSDKKTIVTRGGVRTVAKNGVETNSKLTQIEFKKQSTALPATVKELKGQLK